MIETYRPMPPIQCKCNSTVCRSGWDVAVRFESVEQAADAGWQVTGMWPRYHFLCAEHREQWLARVRTFASSENGLELLGEVA